MLPILHTDPHLTIINKPPGMLVHRTSIAEDDEPVALQLLRDQLGKTVFPVNRIDRPTSGIVIFAHTPEVTRLMQDVLAKPDFHKQYTALVRGWMHDAIDCDREVKNDRGVLKEAFTRFVPVERLELAFPTDRYPTARFSVVDAFPATGRWHQIRQHLAQLRHYIINDRVHGDGKQNKIFTQQLHISDMFLHARKISFVHPVTGEMLVVDAPFPEHWSRVKEMDNLE
jgi:tRNA pseudouridine65 synthase